jgi:NIPSNAP
MKKNTLLLTLSFFLALTFMSFKTTKEPSPFYEMRVYYSPAGKLETLLGRFRNHTTKLFEKHGMKNIGYWLPIDNKDNKLVYILSYPSKEARVISWKNFMADPEWKAVQKATEANGRIVEKVECTYMTETDFSPNDFTNSGNRVFELRTYKTTPYNLGLLLARFRNYTLGLFTKYGMSNLAYFTQVDNDNTLIYLLGHKSKEAGLASFDGFRKDPEWVAAKDASEKLAKESLTTTVVSEYLVPTDFSPWK